MALSLFVLTGWAGHISLGQFALVGFGAAATGVLYGRHGWDLMLALSLLADQRVEDPRDVISRADVGAGVDTEADPPGVERQPEDVKR